MKDIVITPKQIKREALWLLAAFVVAFALNVYAIIAYNGKWSELFWSLGFVLFTTGALYLLAALVRAVVWLMKKMVNKK